MRLICPNCGAQYEVDETVIPEQGRDVQCSNCGHTWFQPPAHMDTETVEELGVVVETAPPDPGTDDAPKRQGLDPEIASVLREEAAREAAAREADADGLETQAELGIDEAAEAAAERSAAARARMARLRGVDNEASAQAAMAAASVPAGSRKELLPDVEEINSSLRANSERKGDAAAAAAEGDLEQPSAPKKRRSFLPRLLLIVILLAIVVYYWAATIVQYVPQSEPYMVQYVEWVNGLRAQVTPVIQNLVDQVMGLIGGGDTPAE